MADEIITELWEIKDGLAREHGYDLDALVAHLQDKKMTVSREVVDLSSGREAAEPARPDEPSD